MSVSFAFRWSWVRGFTDAFTSVSMSRSRSVCKLVATHHVQVCLVRGFDETAQEVLESGLALGDRSEGLLESRYGGVQGTFFLRF